MFAQQWGWEKDTDFHHKLSQDIDEFRECNRTLFNNTQLLRSLPDAEVLAYARECIHPVGFPLHCTPIPPARIIGPATI